MLPEVSNDHKEWLTSELTLRQWRSYIKKIGSELIMWYVIQTVNGQEEQVCTWINQRMDQTLFERCFVPLYEDVWRKEGVGHISVRKTFAGYVFIKTDRPDEVYEELRKIPKLAIMLSDQLDQSNQKEKTFIPVSEEEEQFLRSIYTDGIMRVSYIEKNSNGRVTAIIGPLEQYQDYIIKLDLSHRRAVAEILLFGQMRRMKFGLWCGQKRMQRFRGLRKRKGCAGNTLRVPATQKETAYYLPPAYSPVIMSSIPRASVGIRL